MRSIAWATILLIGAAWTSNAQSSCSSLYFRNTPSASLTPSANTLLYLPRQVDGSYASYETSINPYQVLSITPHFEKQLTTCVPAPAPAPNPTPLAPANPAGAASQPQAVALLASGQYLVVAPVNSATGTFGAVATLFDQQLNLVSSNSYQFGPGVGGLVSVSLADVNGDGNLDLVGTGTLLGVHSMVAQLIVMLGRGGSSFGSPTVIYQGGPYTDGVSLAIGDLNGDHKPDLVMAFNTSLPMGMIVTFLGNGDRTFQANRSMATDPGVVFHSIAIADLDGDGILDVAASYSNDDPDNPNILLGSGIAVSAGKGDGSLLNLSYIQAAGNSIAIGDVNADGIPDIVTNGTLLFGDGKGSFPTRQDYQFESSGSVILTDFDGDGRMDVVVAQGSPALIVGEPLPSWDTLDGRITVLFAQADGTFRGPALSVEPELAQDDNLINDLRTADFNGDGIPDLVYAGISGIGTMLGKGDGTFVLSSTSSSTSGWEVATGDFDRDGNQDIVTLVGAPPGQPGVLSFFVGKGDGTFQTPIATPVPSGSAALVTGDFNGDGKPDLAISFNTDETAISNEVIIFLGNGEGAFHQGMAYQGGGYWMVTGDLNNDGKPDLVISGPNSIASLLGKGDGTFAQAVQVAIPVANPGNVGPSMISLADFNHDGKPDVAVLLGGAETAGFAVLLGKGDGTFLAPLINPLAWLTAIGTADLNFDGVADLVVAGNGGAFNYAYLLGNGDGSFQTPVSFNLPFGQGGSASALLLADLNHDGQVDLVSTAFSLGFFSLLNFGALPPSFQVVSSASFAIGPVAPNSFVTAFGTGLPTPRESLSITVTDSAGVPRQATALFSSATQLNFFMPAGVKAGPVAVDVRVAINGPREIGTAEIAPLAPGLFAENAAGLAAAYAVRVDATGNQSFEPIFTVQNGQVVATPIDLGSSTDQLFLCLFGTGFDAATAKTTTATVAGQPAQVTYAAPQGEPGLDQVNVLLPRSVAGSGDSLVVLSVNGAVANAVHVTIQ